jgi:hypothetical protein
MLGIFLLVCGIVLNSTGLLLFGDGVTHSTLANGAILAGSFDGISGLLLINVGIVLIVVGLRFAGRR